MATLADIKDRIATEMERGDLEDELASLLATHIERACEFYADRKFWFNSIVTTAVTTPSVATVAIPATVRIVERVTAYECDLQEAQLDDLPAETGAGTPRLYAYYNDSLRLYPTPSGAITLTVYGVAQIDAPDDDADSNAWTNEAQDLIVGHVKMALYRGALRDPEGAQMAIGEVQDALGRLQRETARRLRTPLRMRERITRPFGQVMGGV